MGKKRNLALYLLVFLFAVPSYLLAQQNTVTGRVIEKEIGDPLPGVTIIVGGSSRGVTTDFDGTFEIRVSPSDK